MFIFNKRLIISGMGIWAVATIALRLAGQYVLRPGDWVATLILFAVTLPAMAWLARSLCCSPRLPPEQWLVGAASLALPTLVLDTFSSACFPVVFPNMSPDVAGVFGGWMLWCCAGALVGAAFRPSPRA